MDQKFTSVAVSATVADAAEAIAETVEASTYLDLVGAAEFPLEDEPPPVFPAGDFGTTVWKLLEVSDAPILCIFEVVSDLVMGERGKIIFIEDFLSGVAVSAYFLGEGEAALGAGTLWAGVEGATVEATA